MKLRRTPAAPRNVRIEYADGTVTPLELIYTGRDTDGLHLWEAIAPAKPMGVLDQLQVDLVPAHTKIQVVYSRTEA